VLAALAVLVLAVARPERTVAQPKRQATVMLVTDISGSMSATDVEPDRLTAAQRAARTFVEKLPATFKIGFVAFNEYAELQLPPTTDRAQVGPVIDGLDADGGTAMGDGPAARRRGDPGRDGPRAARLGRRPQPPRRSPAVGRQEHLGDRRPHRRRPERPAAGDPHLHGGPRDARRLDHPARPRRLRADVPVPPDPETLKAIADATAAASSTPRTPTSSRRSTRRSAPGSVEQTREEITAAFAGGGLLLLLIGGGLGLRWFGRPCDQRRSASVVTTAS
jgi:Ca-activated chloride channel family protein